MTTFSIDNTKVTPAMLTEQEGITLPLFSERKEIKRYPKPFSALKNRRFPTLFDRYEHLSKA